MDAPKCRLCGTKHWGPCPAYSVTAEPKRKPVTKLVTPVTASVTHECPRCADLEAEVRHLKRLLAERVPMTDAERSRRYRARKRQSNPKR